MNLLISHKATENTEKKDYVFLITLKNSDMDSV